MESHTGDPSTVSASYPSCCPFSVSSQVGMIRGSRKYPFLARHFFILKIKGQSKTFQKPSCTRGGAYKTDTL